MPAQELTVSRQTQEPEAATQFDISSSGTQTLGSLPSQLGINLLVAIVAVHTRDLDADPRKLQDGEIIGFSSERMATDWLSVITSGPLHLRSTSVEPVAALSPPEDRGASLAYSGGGGTPGGRTLKVSTRFNLDALDDGRGENAFPILDVLGPSVTMWAPIKGVRYPYTPTAYVDPLPVSAEGQEYESQVQEWQIPSLPPPPQGWTAEIVVQTLAPMFASRLAIQPAHRQSQPSVSEDGGAGTGTVTISAPHVVENATQLIPKFKAADRHPKFWIQNLPFIPTTQTSGAERQLGNGPGEATYDRASKEFEFPPTPPRSGINVFGDISDLRFSDATADLTIGTESRSISAGTPLEFRNIKGTGIVGHHMLIPVRVDGHEAKIHVIGEADARVNGLPVASERSWIASVLSDEKVSWFLALVASLSFVQGLRLNASRNERRAKKS